MMKNETLHHCCDDDAVMAAHQPEKVTVSSVNISISLLLSFFSFTFRISFCNWFFFFCVGMSHCNLLVSSPNPSFDIKYQFFLHKIQSFQNDR